MKLNISFVNFKKNYKNKKNQILFISKTCRDYSKVENLLRFLLVKKNSFIFESVEKGKIRGRYTIIGFNPDKIWEINKNKINCIIEGKRKLIKSKPLNFLNNLLNRFDIKAPKGLPKMSSMLVGYFSYDIIRYIEKIQDKCHDDLNLPDVRLVRPVKLIIYDNLKKKYTLLLIVLRIKKIKIIIKNLFL